MSTDGQVAGRAPIYARLLRLRRLKITGLMSFLLLECTVAVAILLALAELVSWWAVPLLPVLVAVMVKVNDMVGGPGKAPVTAVAVARSSRVTTQRDHVSTPVDDRPLAVVHDRSEPEDSRSDWETDASDQAWDADVPDRAWAEREWPVDRPTEEIMLPAELTGRPRQRQAVLAGSDRMVTDDDESYTPSEYVTDSIPTDHQRYGAHAPATSEAYASRASRDVYETQEFPGVRDTGDYAQYESAHGYPAAPEYAPREHAPVHRHAAHDGDSQVHEYEYANREYANRGYTGHEYTGDEYASRDYAGQEYASRDYAGHDYASSEYAGQEYTAPGRADYGYEREQVHHSGRHAAVGPDAAPVHSTVPAARSVPEYADAGEYAPAAFAGSMTETLPAIPVVPATYGGPQTPATHAVPEVSATNAAPAQAVPAARSMSGGSLAAAGSALTARGRSAEAYSGSRSPATGSRQEGPARTAASQAAGTYGTAERSRPAARSQAADRPRPAQSAQGAEEARPGSHAASYWSRVAAGDQPGGPAAPRPEGSVPPNLPGAAAPRRAQLFGAAVRRSMAAQAQQIGVNALGGTTRGASTRGSRGTANDTGRHSRGDGNGSSRQAVRFNDRGFGRLRDA